MKVGIYLVKSCFSGKLKRWIFRDGASSPYSRIPTSLIGGLFLVLDSIFYTELEQEPLLLSPYLFFSSISLPFLHFTIFLNINFPYKLLLKQLTP